LDAKLVKELFLFNIKDLLPLNRICQISCCV